MGHKRWVLKHPSLQLKLLELLHIQSVLVQLPILHNHTNGINPIPCRRVKPLFTAADCGNVLQRVTVYQQNICIGTFFDNTQFSFNAWIKNITGQGNSRPYAFY